MTAFSRFLFSIIALLCINTAIAQQQSISGKVTSSKNGNPLNGASVKVKGSAKGTSTNSEGLFTIMAKMGDVLQITMVDHQPLEVNVTSANMSVQLVAGQNDLGEIVIVGSRRPGRVKLETPVPVDVVNVAQVALPTARMDLTSILNYAAPSFNYNKQSGSDGADHVDLATLRGLGPDQTLVLVNGKRRHQTAFVAVFGTRGRGNSGTDLNTIPMSAIDRVEVLRDGASAQYGSDAIAGVINIILKKNVKLFSANVGYAGYYDKKYNTAFNSLDDQFVSGTKIDGNALTANLNYGARIGKSGGFVNMSADFLASGKTFRQVTDTTISHENGLPINVVRRAHGDGSNKTISTMYNMELPVNNKRTTFYSYGGYTNKASEDYAYSRNFSARPSRFPTTPGGDIIYVPGIMHTTPDGEIYYNPIIQTTIQDYSVAAGLRGSTRRGWSWDASNVLGNDNFTFYGDKTFNASLPNAQKTHFRDGGFSFLQNTANINFDKEIAHVASGFHLALGAEYRYENYKIFSGEKDSYLNYSNGDKASGSQGFPGYQPADVVNAKRSAVAAYVDAEMDVTKKFLVGVAVRAENYNDFGFTSNYKLAARYKVTPKFNIRGSVSTGFRAPSLQQINFSSTFTTVQGLTVSEVKIAPNYSPITKAAGIEDLKQEKSINASFGFTYKPVPELSISIDGYYVKIKDRIVLSGQFDASDPTLDYQFRYIMDSLHAGLAQFFANAVDTKNTGVDVVIDYNKKIDRKHSFKALFTANFQNMTIDDIHVPAKLNDTRQHQLTFLSDREQAFILASAPKTKMAANLEYTCHKLTVGARFTYFGRISLLGYGEDGLGIDPQVPSDTNPFIYFKDEYNYHAKVTSDVYASYKLTKWMSIHGGVDNVFNVHPDLSVVQHAKYWAFNNETGGPWDAIQMGANGMRFFTRLSFNF